MYRRPVRHLIAGLLLLASCRAEEREHLDGSTAAVTVESPAPETPPAADSDTASRKRACINAALADADPRVHGLLRALCAEWVEGEIPGLALAIVEPDAPVFTLELGVRCLGRPETVDPTTAFRYGSVSKAITAALALGLVAEGDLGLDARAGQRIDGFEAQAGLPDPSLDALLHHRSGLGDIEPARLVELEGAWLPALAHSAAAGSPGEYHYSNSGYSVVGAMLGADYAQLVRERIATPLGLRSVVVKDPMDAACGHLGAGPEGQLKALAIGDDLDFMPGDPRWMNPAGGVIGSATDLARFALALGTEALPGTEAMLELGEPLRGSSQRADERYGRGLRSWALDQDTRAYGHSGNNGAFVAELMFVPRRRAIVLLANRGVELPASVDAAQRLLGE